MDGSSSRLGTGSKNRKAVFEKIIQNTDRKINHEIEVKGHKVVVIWI